jgi:SAM-dependent methyltransferase
MGVREGGGTGLVDADPIGRVGNEVMNQDLLMDTARRPGPLGALVDETETAVGQFVAAVRGLDAAALDAPRQPDGELRTVREVAGHLLFAAHVYLNLQRRAFGLAEEPWTDPPADPAMLRRELEGISRRAWVVLEDKAEWDDDQLCAVRMEASWGQVFDLEQLLEHALAHVLRHRRQVARWLASADPGSLGNRGETGPAGPAVYLATAEWYDRIYGFKDYEGEAARVVSLVRKRHPRARTLLDVACGTGRHLECLFRHFQCEGLDLSPAQLDEARRLLPDMPLHVGDMRHFQLGRRFDVVTCLFSAIGYMATLEDLARACRNLAGHLEPGGLLLVEPWIQPEHWVDGRVHALFIDEPELKLARINTSASRGRLSVLDMHHLVGTPLGTEHVLEHHELLLATVDELRAALEAAGLEPEFDSEGLSGRGLWLARRPG